MLRFMTIGDPHLRRNVTDDEEQRLAKAVNYINSRNDIDFVVVMGDLANDGTLEQFTIGKSILNGLNKPYYVVEGNHDILIDNLTFSNYFGPAENVIKMNGYQLLFVGIWSEPTPGSPTGSIALHWSFNFNDPRIDKAMPTIVFVHGTVQDAPAGCCLNDTGAITNWNDNTKYFKYAWDMQPELDKFTKLIGVYSGHVHIETNITVSTPSIYPVQYITAASLTDNKYVGWLTPPTDNIGYSMINNGKLSYNLLNYTVPISMPAQLAIIPPANIIQTATGVMTVVNIGTATTSGGTPPITIKNNSPLDGFPVGQTTVIWTAIDSVGTVVHGTQLITVTSPNLDITAYYRGLGLIPNIVETSDLLQAANDWRDNIIPPGFSVPINTNQLLTLADEWRNS